MNNKSQDERMHSLFLSECLGVQWLSLMIATCLMSFFPESSKFLSLFTSLIEKRMKQIVQGYMKMNPGLCTSLCLQIAGCRDAPTSGRVVCTGQMSFS